MNEKKLKETAARHAPAAQKGRHIVTAFVSGGLIGAFGQLLLVVYQQLLHLDHDQALAMMSACTTQVSPCHSTLEEPKSRGTPSISSNGSLGMDPSVP